MHNNYYKILGVPNNATSDEVKNAWRQLVLKHHPDRNPDDKDATKKLQEINEAYEVLSDPEKRRTYDVYGPDWEIIYKYRYSGRSKGYYDEGIRGDDQQWKYRLTIRVAAKEHEQTVKVRGRSVTLIIPAGVRGGREYLYRGCGALGKNGGPNGDLRVYIHIEVEPGWRLVGTDIYATTPVDLYTALLGGEIFVETLDRKVKIKIKPGSQNGSQMKLKGKGYPQFKDNGPRGDFYVVLDVKLPTKLNPEERELVTKLGSLRK
jgi:curved DNA-binding protein